MEETTCGFYWHEPTDTLWAARVSGSRIVGISGPLAKGQLREVPMKFCRFGHIDPAAAKFALDDLLPKGAPWVVSGRETARPVGSASAVPGQRQIEQVGDGFEIRLVQ